MPDLFRELTVYQIIIWNEQSNQFYQLVGNYTQVKTENDYEFENIGNSDDYFVVSNYDLKTMLRNDWKITTLETMYKLHNE